MCTLRTALGELVAAALVSNDPALIRACGPVRKLVRGGYIDPRMVWSVLVALVREDEDGVLSGPLEAATAEIVQELLARADEDGVDAVASDLESIGGTHGCWRAGCAAWVEEALSPEAVFDACQHVVALFPARASSFAFLVARYAVDARNPYADLLTRSQPLAVRRSLVALLFAMGATHHDWTRWLEWLPAEVRGATSGVMADVLWSLSSDSNFKLGTALPGPPEITSAGWIQSGMRQARTA